MKYFPDMPRKKLLYIVASLPHSYGMSHSRIHYTTEGFVDDFGDIILPCNLNYDSYMSRYYFFKGTL